MGRDRGRAVLAAVVVAVGALLARRAGAQVSPTAAPATLRVVGEAKVVVKPDVAEIDLGVISQARTAAAAGDENAAKIDRVVRGLREAFGRSADVSTVGYFAVPNPSTEGKGPPTIESYTVTNVVRVRLRDVRQAGRAIDLALARGANTVQRLVFTVADEAAPRAAALRAAAEDARAQATALARALGVGVGRVLNIEETDAGARPMTFAHAESRAEPSAVPTPVEPGPVEVHAGVTVTFEVAPGR